MKSYFRDMKQFLLNITSYAKKRIPLGVIYELSSHYIVDS